MMETYLSYTGVPAPPSDTLRAPLPRRAYTPAAKPTAAKPNQQPKYQAHLLRTRSYLPQLWPAEHVVQPPRARVRALLLGWPGGLVGVPGDDAALAAGSLAAGPVAIGAGPA